MINFNSNDDRKQNNIEYLLQFMPDEYCAEEKARLNALSGEAVEDEVLDHLMQPVGTAFINMDEEA